ncbi:MAG: hypothetical protein DME19_19395 [Verrucomicrobia bacterium]|nr:MAG: hypothetical protein DME19_19395 [Verrucomicrobiota bacterium]
MSIPDPPLEPGAPVSDPARWGLVYRKPRRVGDRRSVQGHTARASAKESLPAHGGARLPSSPDFPLPTWMPGLDGVSTLRSTATEDGSPHRSWFTCGQKMVWTLSTKSSRRKPWAVLVLVLPLFIAGCGNGHSNDGPSSAPGASESPGAASQAATVFDLAGHRLDPFELASAKVFVFIFVSTDCPISNRYAPEIRRVEGKFAPAGVRFWLVYPDPDTSPDAIQKHLKDYQLPPEALRDPQHGLVRLSQVHVTPESAVFLPDRRLVYHGRIDNRYADLGKERPEATQHDLENVLEAVVQRKPVPYATAPAVGCYISDPK